MEFLEIYPLLSNENLSHSFYAVIKFDVGRFWDIYEVRCNIRCSMDLFRTNVID